MKRHLMVVAVAVTLCGMATTVAAEIYCYTDGRGQLHFVDDIAKVPRKYRSQLRSADGSDAVSTVPSPATPARRPTSSQSASPKERGRRFTGTVELYATDWCPHCREAETYLQANGIPYARHDIEKDPAAKRRFDELGGNGVPLIVVGTHRMSGFSPEALEYYLSR